MWGGGTGLGSGGGGVAGGGGGGSPNGRRPPLGSSVGPLVSRSTTQEKAEVTFSKLKASFSEN